jgi:hypothetical protein
VEDVPEPDTDPAFLAAYQTPVPAPEEYLLVEESFEPDPEPREAAEPVEKPAPADPQDYTVLTVFEAPSADEQVAPSETTAHPTVDHEPEPVEPQSVEPEPIEPTAEEPGYAPGSGTLKKR